MGNSKNSIVHYCTIKDYQNGTELQISKSMEVLLPQVWVVHKGGLRGSKPSLQESRAASERVQTVLQWSTHVISLDRTLWAPSFVIQ